MGKAHRGRRFGKSETAIQREALPDFLPPGHQANPAREDRGDAEFESGPSLFDQTPPHENIRGGSQGVGNQTWVSFVLPRLRTNSALPELVVVATLAPRCFATSTNKTWVLITGAKRLWRGVRPPICRARPFSGSCREPAGPASKNRRGASTP